MGECAHRDVACIHLCLGQTRMFPIWKRVSRSAALPTAKGWEEGGRHGGVLGVPVAELVERVVLLAACQTDIHRNQDREHDQRENRGPLQQKAEHDDDETHVLGVPLHSIGAGRGRLAPMLGSVKDDPPGRDQDEAAADQEIAEQV